ncbi:MAG: DUF481 domain-containing protein [Ignavibacteria bacterium]|nr:DUF481 domain-containing protein [Ignavibacteria bacterium]
MKLLKLIILVLFAFSINAFSQVNIELLLNEGEQSNGIFNSLALSSDLDAGNSEDWTIITNFRTDWVQDDIYSFFVTYFKYKEVEGTPSTRKGHFHLRSIFNYKKTFMPEVFIQNNFDKGFNVGNRWLAGTGMRFAVLRIDPEEESSPVLNVDLGTGAMFEYEDYIEESRYTSRFMRSTSYINLYSKINEYVNFQFTSYFQFSLIRLKDRVSLTDLNLEFKIFKSLSFLTILHYRYDNEPPEGLKNYDLELENGIKFSF